MSDYVHKYQRDVLMPCPTCGGDALWVDDDWGFEHMSPNHDHRIECSQCGMRTKTYNGWEESEMLADWNMLPRADTDPLKNYIEDALP